MTEKKIKLQPGEEYLTFIIESELKKKFQEKAGADDYRNMSSMMRVLIKRYLEGA